MASTEFGTSKELKRLFNEYFEVWKRKHRESLGDLALKCGVTSTYLSQVARSGRIPSKPVLMLLAFNFEIRDKEQWLHAASVKETWPYHKDYRLSDSENNSNGFISLNVNMDAFTESISKIIKSEISKNPEKTLSQNQILKVGINNYQCPTFPQSGEISIHNFFSELLELLGVMLQCKIERVNITRWQAAEKLENGEIDLYGPVATVLGSRGFIFSAPFYQLGMSVISRKNETKNLDRLPDPKQLNDLATNPYKICVLKESRSHYFSKTRLNKSEQDLILCDSADEAQERLTLKNISKPAHLFITDSLTAIELYRKSPDQLGLHFNKKNDLLMLSDNTIAARPDSQAILDRINQCILFLRRSGTINQRILPYLDNETKEVINLL